jgi:hypothetical protein
MSVRLAILPRDTGITPVRLLWDMRFATTPAAGKWPAMLALEAEKVWRAGS